jgi:uncharacterized protein YecE (DUF72 family)
MVLEKKATRTSQKFDLGRIPEAEPELVAEATELASRAVRPAITGNVRVGTAGWTDPTLLKSKSFYPPDAQSSQARLEYYARQFGLVEVDATYYALLPAEAAEHWATWTPSSFRFDVKAFPVLTGHPIEISRLPGDLKFALEQAGFERRVYPNKLPAELTHELELRFRLLLEPLLREGKLSSVCLQFPPWFSANRGNARHIEAVAERWQDVPLAVEFRHKSWLASERRARVFDMLRRCNLSYICVDEPDVERGGVPALIEVTNPKLSIMRFHGRNVAGWQKRGATVHERFNYLYSSAELSAWIEALKKLSSEAEQVHAVFNNCVRNYAVLNAKGLAVLLESELRGG